MPATPPRKRRQLQAAPDLWLAVWLDDEQLSPADRRRVEGEKRERRARAKAPELGVGLILPEEGATPAQFDAVKEALRTLGATVVHHGGLPSRWHNMAREIAVEQHSTDGRWPYAPERYAEVARASQVVIACPKEATIQTYATPGVWSAIGYARNRTIPVVIVLPDGSVQ